MERFGWSLLSGMLLVFAASASLPAWAQQGSPDLRQEEETDYYDKWLNQDVVYIISNQEREVFSRLTTDEEKENFIEQFWRRRDTDLKTAANEFREEHYRRIAYANEHFTSGRAGWKSDRGRIYIIHGPPTEIQESFGGPYERPIYEGGGQTTTYPYQVWRYREIKGIGVDIELEFVDKTLTADYKLVHDPFEKDAFSTTPGIGLTLAEERGMATKHDRFLLGGGGDYYPLLAQRYQDQPFVRLERYAGVMRPPALKYNDLKQLVDVNISFTTLPFRIHQGHFRLNRDHSIVPVTVEIANRDLTFEADGNVRRAKVVVYGLVTSLANTVIKEFEDEVAVTVREHQFQQGLLGTSLYQKLLVLDAGRRVKLDLVVKDPVSGKVGVVSRAVSPPSYTSEDLEVSSLVLSDTIVRLTDIPQSDEMFVLGDMRVRPSLDRVFPTDKLMGVYFQVYNAAFDQQTLEPSLRVRYRLLRGNEELVRLEDEAGESTQFISTERIVLSRTFSPALLGVGKYRIVVEIFDMVGNQSAQIGDEFEIVASTATATGRTSGD